MISRRNIRVKVMQCIYALRTGNEFPFPSKIPVTGSKSNTARGVIPDNEELLRRLFDYTIGLFTYQVWFITEVARYAEADARQKASKHLPSASDMAVPVKIAGNELLWRILESPFFKEATAKYHPEMLNSEDWVKQVYTSLTQSTEYAVYNTTPGRDRKSEKEIIEFIYNNLMLVNEDWVSFVEEHFSNWDDDAEMLQLLLVHYLQKPGLLSLKDMVSEEKFKFALDLLNTTEEKKEQIDELIKPKLRNWDPERLAQLDMILLQLGVAEFLYFETIPPKVTINEYIDIAKAYSTNQSGHFVNGILDNVRKELETDNRLHKVAFKK